jgi:hypothetical protein
VAISPDGQRSWLRPGAQVRVGPSRYPGGYASIEPASAVAERREADGKAVGAACRHAGRALEDCFSLNRKAEKAAVYAGWKEMSDYMRENKVPELAPQVNAERPAAREAEDAAARPAAKR